MKKLNINENFISRIWLNKSYYSDLLTTDGKPVKVVDFGIRNDDSGADFKDASMRIDGKLFFGDVEIHKTFKDWKLHGHKKDKKYNKVILQVVMWGNERGRHPLPPKASRSRIIPTVVLSEFLSCSIHDIWKDIINNPSPVFRIPCYESRDKIDENLKIDFINSLGLKRLNYRTARIRERYGELAARYPDTVMKMILGKLLFEYVCEALGFSKNKFQFLKFASSVEFQKIKIHCKRLTDYEAVFFGISGFLENPKIKDNYLVELRNRWISLKDKLKFETMDRSEWMFFRLRPANFPTLRMAYASAFAFELINNNLLENISKPFQTNKTYRELLKLLKSIETTEYWKSHYDFGKKSSAAYHIGTARTSDIIINVILPFINFYSGITDNKIMQDKTEELYSSLKESADNKVLRVMKKQINYYPGSARENQGLIHLHNFYCTKQKCTVCRIGRHLTASERVSDILKIIIY